MELFNQLATKIRTKSEMMAVIICLDEYLNGFFSPQKKDNNQNSFDAVRQDLMPILQENFFKEPITTDNHAVVKEKIEDLREKLHGLRTVQLTLAFAPNDEAISLFSDWIKKNVSPTAIMDLQFDKTIVGGAQIIVDGEYRDYSVRKGLASRFQIQREESMGIIK